MTPIAHYLLAAALSKFMSSEKWQQWADQRIERCDNPEPWLIDLSMAKNIDEMRDAIGPKFEQEKKYSNLPLISDVIIGYYYLTYKHGYLTTKEFLKIAGAEADGGMSELECEDIYSMLNLYEKIENEGGDILRLAKDIDAIFYDYNRLAMKQWKEIEQF